MADKTFDPTTSGYEMQVATAKMQSAIIDEQNSTAQSLLTSTDAEQKNGWAELNTLMEIYNGQCTNGEYWVVYGNTITNDGTPQNPVYTVTYSEEYVAAPGWSNGGKHQTNWDTETQSAAQLASQFYAMGNNGYDSFNQMASSMLSQDTSNSSTMAEFAKDSSDGQGFIANLLASSLA
ncbi:MAG: hypothetical protein KFB95_09205 [Simkaniaceae bacterium]|nr:MAG: hypothetical protein KFB95_09205 [Simkaniaceae bacterium]